VSACSALLGRTYTEEDAQAGQPLPFDIARAHALYKTLLEPDAALIQGKRLLVAPSGALTALPFHVLVAASPETPIPASAGGYANAAWLARSHAITVLPSPTSLRALRQLSPARRADRPYIAFGNPLVLGETGDDRSAWNRESCAAPAVPTALHWASLVLPDVIASYFVVASPTAKSCGARLRCPKLPMNSAPWRTAFRRSGTAFIWAGAPPSVK